MGEFKMCKRNYNITFDLWFYLNRSRSNGKDSYRLSALSFRFSFDIAYCDIYKIYYNEIEQKLPDLGFLVNQKKSQVAPSSTTIQRLGFLINKESMTLTVSTNKI
ncbi:hypothetical protein BD770DRAFT_411593 [Pilaira anomala]|nr:hypothetical protein BD770DRAFT_411593 [Pilaira anomala]